MEQVFTSHASQARASFHIDRKMHQIVGRDKKWAYTDATNVTLENLRLRRKWVENTRMNRRKSV